MSRKKSLSFKLKNTRTNISIISFICATMLTGCGTLNSRFEPTIVDVEVVEAAEDNWTSYNSSELPSVDWVELLDDPILSSLVNEALENNPNVQAAQALYEAAVAGVEIAEADRLPLVSAGAGVTRRQFGFELKDDNNGVADSAFSNAALDFNVTASWEPDLWGRISDQIRSRKLDAQAAQADYAGARLAVVSQVSQTWFSLIETKLLLKLAEKNTETFDRASQLTYRRFISGLSGSSDVRLARATRASSEAIAIITEQQVATLSRNLEILLGRYPSDEIVTIEKLNSLPSLTKIGVPSHVLSRRPDLLAAERRLQAQGFNVDLARKALYPQISFDAILSTSGSGVNRVLDLDSLVASLVSSLAAPIFTGGALKANVRQQNAILESQSKAYAGLVLNAYFEVENGLDAEQRLARSEVALEESLSEAIKAENALEQSYADGLSSILQLLDAQNRRLSAEDQLINVRGERVRNRIRIYVALGGGGYGGNI